MGNPIVIESLPTLSTSVCSTSAPQHMSTATPAALLSSWASLALAAAGKMSGNGSGSLFASVSLMSALAVIHPGGSSVTPLGILTLPNSEPLLHSGERWPAIWLTGAACGVVGQGGGSSSASICSTSAPQHVSTATPAASSSSWASSSLAAAGEMSGSGSGSLSAHGCTVRSCEDAVLMKDVPLSTSSDSDADAVQPLEKG